LAAEIDHIFILTSRGAPAADALVKFGLTEGPPNVHPGQGTACRRFFFENAMLELLWIENAAEAQSAQSRPTRLWDRWAQAGRGASPFGIILRPGASGELACPFDGWDYRPPTMPGLELQIADTGLNEPMWCYVEKFRRSVQPGEHRAGLRKLTLARIAGPQLPANSVTTAMASLGAIGAAAGGEHLLELQFDHGVKRSRQDFRPGLPLLFHW